MKLAVCCVALATVLVAQDTATIEGVVVNKVTGAGIAGVTVRFRASRSNRYEARTGETGAFLISAVKPGDYDAGAEKTGYFTADGGASLVFPGDRPKYHVDASGTPLRVRLELIPPAVIRGRVIGPDGNPAPASVDLGKGRTINTDAEGVFAFDKLPAGPYTLLARPKTVEPASVHEGTRTAVVPTYYPSAVEPTQAQSIVVRAGAELTGYDIRLQSVPVYRVRGVVLNPDGKPAAKAVVSLEPSIPGVGPDRPFLVAGGPRASFSIRTTEVDLLEPVEPFVTSDDGVFEFPSVPAGLWILRAEGEPIGNGTDTQSLSSNGSVMFSLGHGDPDDVEIQLKAPFRLSGTAVLSDGSPPPANVLLGVSLYSETGRSGSGGMTEPGGSLRLDVLPGANQIQADVILGNYYADAILVGSADATLQKMELTPASPPVKVILKPAGVVHGGIEDGAAATVVVFPQTVIGVGYYAQVDAGKNLDVPGIPPGDYYAIALDHFDSRTMVGALRLRSLIPLATSVKVKSASSATVQLRVNQAADQ